MVAKVVTVDFMHDCTTVNNSGLIQKIEIMPDSEIKIVFHFENPLTDVVGGESGT